jgi:hypothetical protein
MTQDFWNGFDNVGENTGQRLEEERIMEISGSTPFSGIGTSRPVGTTATTQAAAATAAGKSQFTPTADLTGLLAQLRSTPAVRQEVIGDVINRLNSGELFLPPAPDQVVQGMLATGTL